MEKNYTNVESVPIIKKVTKKILQGKKFKEKNIRSKQRKIFFEKSKKYMANKNNLHK